MIRIEAAHTFSAPLHDMFAYITDMRNWPHYWPDFVRIENQPQAQWSKPGDRVTVVQRLLGREVALHMQLEEFQPDTVVRYRSQQRGLPDVVHERHFTATSDGVEYRLIVSYVPRKGINGLIDRFIVKRAVARALHKTISNLKRAIKKQRVPR
jgi:polyketide cyclase/dehydrase/lipid transport protein